MNATGIKNLKELEATKPDVVDLDGVKYIKASVHNQKIIYQHWQSEMAVLKSTTSLIDALIIPTNGTIKSVLFSIKERLMTAHREVGRRWQILEEQDDGRPRRSASRHRR